MTENFPRTFGDLAPWLAANNVTVEEARQRFAQYVLLCGIVSVRPLRQSLVFKGGNALDFIWQPNRSTIDLDFSLDMATDQLGANAVDMIRTLLTQGARVVSARFGVTLAVYSVRQEPPGENRTFITYVARIGYALPDETRLVIRMVNNQSSPHIIPVEISVNEPICASTDVMIDEHAQTLRVSTLEDIVSEKLRALLQQPIRNRNRCQDLLDIAVIVQAHPNLDRTRIAAFLQVKAHARHVPVSRVAFHNPEVGERARIGYAALQQTTRTIFIPFDEALTTVLGFVDELPMPAR